MDLRNEKDRATYKKKEDAKKEAAKRQAVKEKMSAHMHSRRRTSRAG
jgi:hypothetical protein